MEVSSIDMASERVPGRTQTGTCLMWDRIAKWLTSVGGLTSLHTINKASASATDSANSKIASSRNLHYKCSKTFQNTLFQVAGDTVYANGQSWKPPRCFSRRTFLYKNIVRIRGGLDWLRQCGKASLTISLLCFCFSSWTTVLTAGGVKSASGLRLLFTSMHDPKHKVQNHKRVTTEAGTHQDANA